MNAFTPLDAPSAIPPLWRLTSTFGYDVLLVLVIGSLVAHVAVVRPSVRAAAPAAGAEMLRRSARLAAISGVLLVPALYLKLAASVARSAEIPYAEALAPSRVRGELTTPAAPDEWISSGAVTTVQAGLVVVLALLVAFSVERLLTVALVVALAVPLVTELPTARHLPIDGAFDMLAVQAHVLAGAVWVGGLVTLTVLGLRRSAVPDAGALWSSIWARFSSLALVSAGAVVVSGLWLTWTHVGTIGQLVTTPYGRFLLAKMILVGALLAAGGFNQLVLLPGLRRARAAGDERSAVRVAVGHFPRVVAGEALLGTAVLVVVPFLSGSARAQAGGADAPPIDGGIFLLGLLLVALLVGSFWATVRASDALARRPLDA